MFPELYQRCLRRKNWLTLVIGTVTRNAFRFVARELVTLDQMDAAAMSGVDSKL